MFGSDSNSDNAGANAPLTNPINQSGPPPMDSKNPSGEMPATPTPGTPVVPTAPPLDDQTAHYLESSGKAPSTTFLSSSNHSLETSSGAPAAPADSSSPPAVPAAPEDLAKIKQQALQSLAPLVDHLQQTPEERFKTLMMMIQASDNSDYLDEAYETAGQIKDEKERAQALLDVVNEINYFTQQKPTKSA